jgi:hypothetical protein
MLRDAANKNYEGVEHLPAISFAIFEVLELAFSLPLSKRVEQNQVGAFPGNSYL